MPAVVPFSVSATRQHSTPPWKVTHLLLWAWLLLAALFALPASAQTVVYQNDFETSAGAEWSNNTRATSNGVRFLGASANGFGNGTNSLNLGSLPAHDKVTVEFDLHIIQSWDGNSGDNWELTEVVSGQTRQLIYTNFSHNPGITQAYPSNLAPLGAGASNSPRTGTFAQGALGFGTGDFGDSTYRLSVTFPHSAADLRLNFRSLQNEPAGNEGWGLDNVKVTVSNSRAEIRPQSYDTPNGYTGSYTYWDDTYNGSGNRTQNGAALSGGLGQLTDGVVGIDDFAANLGNGNAYEWLGWLFINPVLTFDLGQVRQLESVAVHANNRQSGGVSLYQDVEMSFSTDGINFGNGLNYTPTSAERADRSARYHSYSAPRVARYVRLRFVRGNDWVFIDEIKFFTPGGVATPETVVTAGPLDGGYVGVPSASFAVAGSDDTTPANELRYRFRLDGGAFGAAAATNIVTFNGLADGPHVFEAVAVDNEGNTDPTPAIVRFIVDTTAPVFTTGVTVTNVGFNRAQINWTTDDAAPGVIEVAIGDGPFTLFYTDERSLQAHAYTIGPLNSLTNYRVRVRAGDAAGNVTLSPEQTFTTSPLRDLAVTALTFSNPRPAHGQNLTMTAQITNRGDVGISATAIFYDVTPQNGTREIGRRAVSIPAYNATPLSVTSPEFSVSEGTHSPYVLLQALTPGDDIGGNNGLVESLPVDAPASRLTLAVGTQRTFPGDDSLFAATVTNTGSQSITLGSPTITGVGFISVVGDVAGSLAPGQDAELLFRMNPSSGETGGPANAPSVRNATLTVAGFATPFTVEVYTAAIGTLDVTITDEATGLPLIGALVALDNSETLYTTGADGKLRTLGGLPATVIAAPGVRVVSAYRPGYIARSRAVAVVSGGNTVTLPLAPGNTLEVSDVTARRLTPTEIAARGVNLSDPNNFFVYDFVLYMKIGAIPVRNVILPAPGTGGLPVFGGGVFSVPGGGGGGFSSVNIQYVINPETRTETWIVIPGDVRILKQFWEATVVVRNGSDSVSISNVVANLTVPSGLSLPDLNGTVQSSSQAIGSIGPLEEKQAQWIVRGDRAGNYRLTGTATGEIQLGGATIPLNASLQSAPLEVIVPQIELSFATPTSVTARQNFNIGITVTNKSPIVLDGVSVNIKADKLVNCTLASAASVSLGSIAIGGSATAPFTFTSLVTGIVEQVEAYVSPLPVEPGVTVIPNTNAVPVAVSDSATTLRNSSVTVAVLANDSDSDGDTLTISQLGAGANGTTFVNPNKSVTYVPNSGFSGADSFTYTVSDGKGGAATATVTVQVNPPSAPSLTLSGVTGITRSGGVITATLRLSNTGGAAANMVRVTSAQCGVINASSGVPVQIASIAPGQEASIVVTFPASAGASGQSVFIKANGTFTGGSFSGSRRVTLP